MEATWRTGDRGMSQFRFFLSLALFCTSCRAMTGIDHLNFEHQSQELVCVVKGQHIEGRLRVGEKMEKAARPLGLSPDSFAFRS